MQGFIRRSIPLLLRRLITMTPALVVLAIGLDPTEVARDQPGGALVRHPVRAGAAGAADAPARTSWAASRNARGHDARWRAWWPRLIIALNLFLLAKTFAG